jgi:ABC-type Zn2+ transport system substrate-binding protein/surface adhesin
VNEENIEMRKLNEIKRLHAILVYDIQDARATKEHTSKHEKHHQKPHISKSDSRKRDNHDNRKGLSGISDT